MPEPAPHPEKAALVPREGGEFDRYDLLENLRGGRRSGRTFFALDRTTGEPLVVQATPHLEAASTLYQNSYRLARMSNITSLPPLLGGGVSDGMAYLASSWIPGPSLRELVATVPPDPRMALGILWNLARGLSHLHGQGLFHGDLHPGNVRVDPRGRTFLAGYFPAPYGAPATRARDGDVLGRYVPPEAYEGAPADPAADVFGLGLVAFELFVHQPLLEPADAAGARAQLEDLPGLLDARLRSEGALGGGLGPVLRRMLEPNQEARPQTGSEVLSLLLDVVAIDEPERSQKRLAAHVQRCLSQLARATLRRGQLALARGALPRAVGCLWRYAQLIPPADKARVRKGYDLLTELFWSTKLQVDQGAAGIHPALFYVLHRVGSRWSLRTVSMLAAELCHRLAPEDNLLPAFLPEPPLDEAGREAALEKHRRSLRKKVRAPKSLLALAVLTPDFRVEPGESPPRYSSRLLEAHGLAEVALFYRAQDLPHTEDRAVVVEDLARLVEVARAGAARPPSSPGPTPAPTEASEAPEDELEDHGVVFAGLPSVPPPRPASEEEADEAEAATEDSEERPDLLLEELTPTPPTAPPPPAGAAPVAPPEAAPELQEPEVPEEIGPVPGAPLPSQPPRRPDEAGAPLTLEDAATLFSRGQMLLIEEELEDACAVFEQVMAAGALEREHFRSSILAELRKLLWRALTDRAGAPEHSRDLLQRTWDLAHRLRLREIMPVCERLLLQVVPEGIAESMVKTLLKKRPTSLLLRQAAARTALEHKDRRVWGKHLVAAGQVLTALRLLFPAAKLMMAARTALPDLEIQPLRERVLDLGGRIAAAGVRFRELEARLPGLAPLEAVDELSRFLEFEPNFQPAQERLLELAEQGGTPQSATPILMHLGRLAMVADDLEVAGGYFRRILATELENDEAMLHLAAMQPALTPWPPNLRHVRSFLLDLCELPEAAFHNAIKELRGGEDDRPLLELLVRLSQATGRDSSRHTLALAVLELERGDTEAARQLCRQAIDATTDAELLATSLLRIPGIEAVLSGEEIQKLMAARSA